MLSEAANINHVFKNSYLALAGIAQWMKRRPVKQRIAGSTPSQSTFLVVGQVPSRRSTRDNHTLMFLSLPFSFLSPSLKINK